MLQERRSRNIGVVGANTRRLEIYVNACSYGGSIEELFQRQKAPDNSTCECIASLHSNFSGFMLHDTAELVYRSCPVLT